MTKQKIFTEKIWVSSDSKFIFKESTNPTTGEKKYILRGLMMPKGQISRNNVLYEWNSVLQKHKNLIGRPFMFNHQVDGSTDFPYGHFTESICMDEPITGWESIYTVPGWYYAVDVDPVEKNFIRKLERGDLRHVSIQLIGDTVEEKYDGNRLYTEATVGDIVEGSAVNSPGFLDTSAKFAEAFNSKKEAYTGVEDEIFKQYKKGKNISSLAKEYDVDISKIQAVIKDHVNEKEDINTTSAQGVIAPAKLKEGIDYTNEVISFLKQNPNPTDEQLHAWAEQNQYDVQQIETAIYKIASEAVANKDLSESSNQEIKDEVSKKEYGKIYSELTPEQKIEVDDAVSEFMNKHKEELQCTLCHGTGRYGSIECPKCHGTGKFENECLKEDLQNNFAKKLYNKKWDDLTDKEKGEVAQEIDMHLHGESLKEDTTSELAKGITVEAEHKATIDYIKANPNITDEEAFKKIAEDHIAELPDYYTRLAKMEDK